MTPHGINRRVVKYLRSIADKDSLRLRKKSGHKAVIASYAGQERCFHLSSTPGSNYQRNIKSTLKKFLKTLPEDYNYPTPSF